MSGSAEKTFDSIEDGLEGQVPERDMKHAYSLHGSKAAYRRAITELLFFASVGGELHCTTCSSSSSFLLKEPILRSSIAGRPKGCQ